MSDTIVVALISGIVSLMVNFGSKYLDKKNGLTKDISDIKEGITDLNDSNKMNSDMIYQILDHLATDNNTGEMKRALNEYNAHFRHQGG